MRIKCTSTLNGETGIATKGIEWDDPAERDKLE
jgi:hypothetical protein